MTKRTATNLWGLGLVLALVALAIFATWEARGQDDPAADPLTNAVLLEEALARGDVSLEVLAEEVQVPEPAQSRFMASFRAAVTPGAPGTGFVLPPGARTIWRFPTGGGLPTTFVVALTARPWGATGNGALDHATLSVRYWGGVGNPDPRREGRIPPGFVGELTPVNRQALEQLCREKSTLLSPGNWNCHATEEETVDLSWTTDRCSEIYRSGWRIHTEGGSPATAIVIRGGTWGAYRGEAQAQGACAVGLFERESVVCRWPLYMRVEELPEDRPWCATTPPPPPPPAPTPLPPQPPVPQPPPVTSCPAGQTCQAPCPECPEPAECPSVLREIGGLAVALLDGVRWAILPDGTAQQHTEGRYIFVSRTEEVRLRNQAARAAVASDCYLPGVPSTGRVDTELVPEEEP